MAVSVRLRDLSIRNELVVAFAALIVLFAALGGTAIQRFGAMQSSANNLTGHYTLAVGYLGDKRQAVAAYRATILRELVLRDDSPGAADRLDASVKQITDRLDQAEAKYA